MRPGRFFAALALVLIALSPALAHAAEPGPKLLVVTAHPDDDALFSGTIYKTTHALGGVADLAILTNGEGGYRFSTLAEPIYGLKLTDEAVGRAWLPAIRKQELMAGGAIVGLRNYFFFDQVDSGFTKDMSALFATEWDLPFIQKRFAEILAKGGYDFVLVMLPTLETHAHHRAAAILALEAVAARPESGRPVVLAASARSARFPEQGPYLGLPEYPLTKVLEGAPQLVFDRTQKFGQNGRLDYQIIANWVIAEHKSQGTMQLLMGAQTAEVYWTFELNGEAGAAKARAFFDRLAAAPPFVR
ncbi:MAG TPA: PIG-L family deacetylase [Thermoanaerobaculia bacterium]|nr:PIG-L family deacetylase [Thermoanaerobaculia bacterium]